MQKTWLVVLLMLLLPGAAMAQSSVRSGTWGYEAIDAGVFEISVDNMLLLGYSKQNLDEDGDAWASELRVAYIGGVTPRYFVAKNVSVALNLNLFLGQDAQTTKVGDSEETQTSTDVGFLGTVMAHYYLRLGNSMFLKPGLGGGAFFGTRSVPGMEEGTKIEHKLSGGIGRLDIGLVYYASKNFNMKAGIDTLMWFGSVTNPADESRGYFSIDAGFNVGLAYSF